MTADHIFFLTGGGKSTGENGEYRLSKGACNTVASVVPTEPAAIFTIRGLYRETQAITVILLSRRTDLDVLGYYTVWVATTCEPFCVAVEAKPPRVFLFPRSM